MEFPSKDVLDVIRYLLPGFLAAWVFYGLTPHPKQTPFERVVQALIFTLIVQGITALGKSIYAAKHVAWTAFDFGKWSDTADAVAPATIAVIVGLVFAFFANHDWLHWVLRKLQVTKRTSYPSEWFSAFNRGKRKVILHLDGERRVRGWPYEWPDQPDSGHFVLMDAEWILDNNECAPLYLVKRLIIPAKSVEMVEIEKRPKEVTADSKQVEEVAKKLVNLKEKENENGKQSAPTAAETETRKPILRIQSENGESAPATKEEMKP